MITVMELKAFVETLQQEIPGFAGYLLASDEDHIINKIADRPGVQLAVVYPSGTREGKQNSPVDQNSILLFIVEMAFEGQTDEKEIAQYQKLQNLALKIIEYVDEEASEGCNILRSYDPSGTTIDPEYNCFGGFNGWSISLIF